MQRNLKKSEANNSALEARISKFINSSSMRSRRKREWSDKKQKLQLLQRMHGGDLESSARSSEDLEQDYKDYKDFREPDLVQRGADHGQAVINFK